MNEESKLIELFKKYPGIAARRRSRHGTLRCNHYPRTRKIQTPYHGKIPILQG